MATTHLGLVFYGCAVAAILRSQGVGSASIEREAANVNANQNGDLEQQLMQQSGENKSSQPSLSVNHADPRQDAPMPADDASLDVDAADADADAADGDDVEATGLSSDYYGLQSFDDATQPERLNDQLREDGIEDIPAAAGPEEEEGGEEEDRNSNGQLLDEKMNNGRNQEGYNINFQERRSFEDDAEKTENEENNREFRNDDDIEQMERPWEDVNDLESQEAPPSGVAAASSVDKEIISDGDSQENGRDNESTDQPMEKEKEKREGEEGDGERTRLDRQNLEQQRYTEDGQRNTAETFDSRLLISREKKTLQGKWMASELDKSDMQRDEGTRRSDDDNGLTEDVYM